MYQGPCIQFQTSIKLSMVICFSCHTIQGHTITYHGHTYYLAWSLVILIIFILITYHGHSICSPTKLCCMTGEDKQREKMNLLPVMNYQNRNYIVQDSSLGTETNKSSSFLYLWKRNQAASRLTFERLILWGRQGRIIFPIKLGRTGDQASKIYTELSVWGNKVTVIERNSIEIHSHSLKGSRRGLFVCFILSSLSIYCEPCFGRWTATVKY